MSTRTEELCIAAFKTSNHSEAVRLLPSVREPKKLFAAVQSVNYVYRYIIEYHNVGLLHLAVINGWLDVVKDLITIYNFEPAKGGCDVYTHILAAEKGQIHIVKYLITECGCNPEITAYGQGETCLHVAVEKGQIDLIRFLIIECGCNPEVTDGQGKTCLHVAVKKGRIDLIRFLIIECGCNPEVTDGQGKTCLHVAVEKGHIDVVKYLITECGCNPEVTDGQGKTCLHVAVEKGHIDVVKYLITECGCNPEVTDGQGKTCLYVAVEKYKFNILKFLITKCGCNPEIADGQGKTCLHVAVEKDHTNIAKYLIMQSSCNPKADEQLSRNCLYIAINTGDFDLLKYLINVCDCDPNKEFCLHVAVEKGHIDIVKFLITECGCNPEVTDEQGKTCLHIAVGNNKLNILRFLITEYGYNPEVADGQGKTCLQVAVEKDHTNIAKYLIMQCSCNPIADEQLSRNCLDIAISTTDLDLFKYLINECGCDPMSPIDKEGRTCLHLAVEKCGLSFIEYLLSTGLFNPTAKDNFNKTPLNVARGNQAILSLFAKFGDIKTSHPVDSYVNVLLLGNPGAGKSTLAQVIIERANGVITFKQLRNVKGVDLCTAGIIPTKLQHKELGNIILHDFAGHSEYYSSHTAVIENLLQGSGAVFVIVVDITNEESSKYLQQWLTVVNNEIHKCINRCHIVVVVSHIDKMADTITMNKRINELSDIISLRCGAGVSLKCLDCRKLGGGNVSSLFDDLSSFCQSIRSDTSGRNLSLYCHTMYAFLDDSEQNIISLSDIVSSPLKVQYSLPKKVEEIHKILCSLSSTGLICLVKSCQDENKLWVVVNKQILLAEVDGILFAPKSFKEYRNVASNTGIVALSSLIHLFPHYDPDMLISFLTNMALCQEISPQFLTMTNLKASIEDDRLLFFPTLLDIDRPTSITGRVFKFGWYLHCTEDYLFFPSHFFHILMLHLAYKYGLPKYSGPLPIINRQCTFWRNGIHWFNGQGVESLVEMVDESQSVLVLMSNEEGYESNMVSSRRDVIAEIMSVQHQIFPCLKLSEFLIDSKELKYPIDKPRHKTVYNVADIFAAVRERKDFVNSEPHLGGNEILKSTQFSELLTNEKITDITQLSISGEHHLTPEELTRRKAKYTLFVNIPANDDDTHFNRKCDKPQIYDLMNMLAEIAHQYDLIGTALKVPELGLHPLPQYYKGNLKQTLQWWIDNGDKVESPVTWDNIISAIEGPIVENYRIAEKMRREKLNN